MLFNNKGLPKQEIDLMIKANAASTIQSIATLIDPDTEIKPSDDIQDEVNFAALETHEVIDLISHYLANTTLPFF